jgi:hypothetical protein
MINNLDLVRNEPYCRRWVSASLVARHSLVFFPESTFRRQPGLPDGGQGGRHPPLAAGRPLR